MSVNTSSWSYADYDSKETVEERLACATLHAAEVRQAIVEQGAGKGRHTRMPESYILDLNNRIEALRTEIRTKEAMTNRSVAAKCPVNLRPRF